MLKQKHEITCKLNAYSILKGIPDSLTSLTLTFVKQDEGRQPWELYMYVYIYLLLGGETHLFHPESPNAQIIMSI